MALGARPGDAPRMVISQGARLGIIRVVLGLLASLGSARLMSSLFFGVGASDPLTFAGVWILLAPVALVACYIPERRRDTPGSHDGAPARIG